MKYTATVTFRGINVSDWTYDADNEVQAFTIAKGKLEDIFGSDWHLYGVTVNAVMDDCLDCGRTGPPGSIVHMAGCPARADRDEFASIARRARSLKDDATRLLEDIAAYRERTGR